MAFHFDSYDGSIVIDGFENGVGDSPYTGLSDVRNVNVTSVPGEAFVNFATAQITNNPIANVVVTGLAANILSFAATAGLQNKMAIEFTQVGGLTGVSTGTTYWLRSCGGSPSTPSSAGLYSDYKQSTVVTIGGAATGSPTFKIYQFGVIPAPAYATGVPYWTYTGAKYFIQDSLGQVWSNMQTTDVGGSGLNEGLFTFTGLTGTTDTNAGNGLGYYQPTGNAAGVGYVFSFNSQSIDYFKINSTGDGGTWTWGWKPSDATTHNTGYLKVIGIHAALLAPDNRLYYCDGQYIGSFYETNPATPFDPTSTSSYTQATKQLLPGTDSSQCLTFLGTNLLIGGKNNVIYPWDRFSTNFNYPLLLPESNVINLVTVNTATYIFTGNRGRIYITNGTNVSLFKKIPDHISGTVEPYFKWGGATYNKNQIYFSFQVFTNANSAINQYGGVWAIDIDSEALRLTNQLSYGTYAGYATALIANFGSDPAGTGLFIAWNDGSSTNFGIDTTAGVNKGPSVPYTGSQATIDTDLIPIGTFNKPRDSTQIEYKLSRPLVSGESVVIKSRLIFNTQDTGYTQTLSDSTVGNYSNTAPANFKNAQWVQFQIVLNSTSASPSYVRFKQLRILGLIGPTLANTQQLSL